MNKMVSHSSLIVHIFFSMYSIAAGRLNSYRSNETDLQALLEFKAQLSDPLGALSSWNNTLHVCEWNGVACGRSHERVTKLELASQQLRGSLSPFIGNLTFLRTLNLAWNYLYGELPPQISQLRRLSYLNLTKNAFQGEIPPNISEWQKLAVVHLANNKLEGAIPTRISSLQALVFLGLSYNNLTGKVPDSFGNFSARFYHLSIAGNNFHGSIPYSIGQIPRLIFLQLSENQLSGEIPPPIFNMSSLVSIHLALNELNGKLPSDLAIRLPNLRSLLLGSNMFRGVIPISITNASKLVNLDLGRNSFVGLVPRHLGSLKNLEILSLAGNLLGTYGENASDLDFITSLVNCTRLVYLLFNNNHFGGFLPAPISNLSKSLKTLMFGYNQIHGSFPSGMAENYGSLTKLSISSNFITGTIPSSIGKLQHLEGLGLSINRLHGQIPLSVGNMTSLTEIVSHDNNLQGTIPPSFGNCTNLQILHFSANRLSGSLPPQVLLPSLLNLGLSSNFLTGSLPPDVGRMKNLLELDISGNKFYGKIPTTIGGCSMLQNLNMEKNLFEGYMPESLENITDVQIIRLAHNNLTGQIPSSLGKLQFLEYLDLSFNDFAGEVPKEGVFGNASALNIRGNDRLCGGIRQLNLTKCQIKDTKPPNRSHHLHVAVLVALGIIGAFILLSCFYATYRWLRRNKHTSLHSTNPSLVSFPMISYLELFRATNGFSSASLIGSGTHGSVYKGLLGGDQEETIAVKVFNIQYEGASKSFDAECKVLKNIRHRNLLKIRTACSSIDSKGEEFKALVFDYMPNGSLNQWLHPHESDNLPHSRRLSLLQRLNIAIDVACAVDYLHSDCLEEPIVHRDLKPSNVLLDPDMVAHVGDFGLSKFLHGNAQKTTSTIGIGTVGYAAPEYGLGGAASTDGDIYSYGILLLEMLTGVRPTDERLKDHLDLHQFAKSYAQRTLAFKIIDPSLLYETGEMHEIQNHEAEVRTCIFSMLEIGVNCSKPSPQERKKMKDVLTELRRTRERYMSHGIGN